MLEQIYNEIISELTEKINDYELHLEQKNFVIWLNDGTIRGYDMKSIDGSIKLQRFNSEKHITKDYVIKNIDELNNIKL